MAKKIKLFNPANILTTLKAMVIGIILGIPTIIINIVIALKYPVFAMILMGTWAIISLFLWGFLARKWWSWR